MARDSVRRGPLVAASLCAVFSLSSPRLVRADDTPAASTRPSDEDSVALPRSPHDESTPLPRSQRDEPPLARTDDASESTVFVEAEGGQVFLRTKNVVTVPVGRWQILERQPVYAPLCVRSSCKVSLAPGAYHLGVAQPDGPVVEAPDPVVVENGTTVRATYIDRSGWRVAGVLTLVGTGIASTALFAASLRPSSAYTSDGGISSTTSANGNLLAAAGAVGLVGLIGGVAMMVQKDGVELSVTPLLGGVARGARESGSAAAPTGLQLTARF